MDMHSRKQLTKIVASRYFKANKRGKSVILNEFCSNCNYEHKYAINLLKRTFIYGEKRTKGKAFAISQRYFSSKLTSLKF